MSIKTKSVTITPQMDENGTITAYASTFTRTPDWANDVVAKGAFADWLAKREAEGTVLPMLYNHDQSSLYDFIGTVTDIREDDHGLLFTASFDDTKEAQRARQLVKDGRLSKLSFAYIIRDQAPVTLEDGTKANELRKLDVSEVSLVLDPCNPDTSVVDVKAGRRNSKADEDELRAVRDLLDEAAARVDGLIGEEVADEDTPDPDDAEPHGGEKSAEEPDADETQTEPAEGGEGDATPEGREVDEDGLDAYRKQALISAHTRTQTRMEGYHA